MISWTATATGPATTEDFKAVLERNMPKWLDLDKNQKLDWFFNAYVYGTEVPKYTITSQFTKKGDETKVHFTLTQAGVSPEFKMLVPIYMEFENKRTVLFGKVPIQGSTTAEKTVKLGKMEEVPKRLVLNYYYDLLSD